MPAVVTVELPREVRAVGTGGAWDWTAAFVLSGIKVVADHLSRRLVPLCL